jgi:hypothetical protein
VPSFFLALSDISIEHRKKCDGDDEAAAKGYTIVPLYAYMYITQQYDMQKK